MEPGSRDGLAAEAVASFVVVSVAAGTAATERATGVGPVGVALAYGLAVAAADAALSPSALGNPALCLAGWVRGERSARRTAALLGAELAGAVAAALALRLLLPADLARASALGTPVPAPGLSPWRALGAELLGTSLVAVAAFGPLGRARPAAAGAATAAATLLALPLSGAALNPARAFGPALVSGTWTSWWVAWAGPVAGAALAALLAGSASIRGRDGR
jgi:aquaporin Z